MKFRVDAAALKAALAAPVKVSFLDVRLHVRDGVLSIAGDDHSVRVETRVPCEADSECLVHAPATLLRDLVKVMPAGSIECTVTDDLIELHGGGTRSAARLIPVDRSSMPLPPVVGGRPTVVDVGEFRRAVSQVMVAASEDITKPVLAALSVRPRGGVLRLAATDSYRLHVTESKAWDAAMWERDTVIPAAAVAVAVAVFDHGDAELTIDPDVGVVAFVTANATVHARLVDGVFPSYDALIPATNTSACYVRVNAERMLDALAATAPVSRHVGGLVVVTATPETSRVVVESTAPDVGEISVVVDAETVKGAEFSFTVKQSSFEAAIRAAAAEQVEMWFTEETKPVLVAGFGDRAYKAVVMPIRV